MTQAYKTPVYEIEIEQIVLEELPVEQKKIPFTLKETNQVEKARLLKKWKKSEGYYYLNPEKFQFSLRNL
jgi:hypothetical protein